VITVLGKNSSTCEKVLRIFTYLFKTYYCDILPHHVKCFWQQKCSKKRSKIEKTLSVQWC